MTNHTEKFFKTEGRKIRVRFGWSVALIKIHIVAVVEDEMIVYRYYGKHKQWWHYGVEHWKRIKFYYELGKRIYDN